MTNQERLKQKEDNWFKGGLMFKYFKEGIHQYAEHIVQTEHDRILRQIGHRSGQSCATCNFRDIRPIHKHRSDPNTGRSSCPWGMRQCNCIFGKKKRKCPMDICDAIYEEILKSHASSPPNPEWRNTDITKWATGPWEIAKCYINAPGYKDKQSAAEIDITGLLHVFINYLECHQYFPNTKVEVFVQMRERRNSLFHSPSMTLETAELNMWISDIVNILDSGDVKTNKDAKIAVYNLKELQTRYFCITTQNETEVLKTALLEVSKTAETLNTFIVDTRQYFAAVQEFQEYNAQSLHNAQQEMNAKQEMANRALYLKLQKAYKEICEREEQACKRIAKERNQAIKDIDYRKEHAIDAIKGKTGLTIENFKKDAWLKFQKTVQLEIEARLMEYRKQQATNDVNVKTGSTCQNFKPDAWTKIQKTKQDPDVRRFAEILEYQYKLVEITMTFRTALPEIQRICRVCDMWVLIGMVAEGSFVTQCKTVGCQFYGMPDFNGYCSSCYRATVVYRRFDARCKNVGCQFYGMPDFNGYCSSCYRAQVVDRRSVARYARCKTVGCQFYGMPDFNGYCSSCYIKVPARVTPRTGRLQKPVQANINIEQGCARLGDPSMTDRCSENKFATTSLTQGQQRRQYKDMFTAITIITSVFIWRHG